MAWDGLERRKFPRANYPCLVTIRHKGGNEEALLTHTENIGIGGICVILKKGVKIFSPVDLEIDLLDTNLNVKCNGKVVWCVQRKEKDAPKPFFFDTGIEFVDLVESDKQRIEAIVQRLIEMGQETPYS